MKKGKSKIKKPPATRGSRVGLSPEAEKETPDYGRKTPIFCLHYVVPAYCITLCSDGDKLAFVKRIRQLSGMTWNEIIQADRHGFGREKIPRDVLHPQIPAHITEDVTLIALRFSGLKPMVGYQRNDVFHIVWFDRDFDLYDHD
jgi:hypothetical protein